MAWSSSSYQPGKTRWAEIKIEWVTDRYFVTCTGRTTVRGEFDKHWSFSSASPAAVVEALSLTDEDCTRYLPAVTRRALEAADGALQDAMLERLRSG